MNWFRNIWNRGITHNLIGNYTYKAANEKIDSVGDTRTFTTDTYEQKERCTAGNAIKGLGTWVVYSIYTFGGSLKFGDIAGGDFVEFEADGTTLNIGKAKGFEDDNLDPTTLTGSGNLPTSILFANTTTHIAAFSGTQTDEVEGCREYPHKAELNVGAGTDVILSFHAHTYATTTGIGNVRLGLEYFFTKEGVAVTTSTIIYKTYTTNGVAWAKQSVSFDNIVAPNELGSQFHFRFFRLGSDALDTYNSNVAISTIGYHYEIDTPGGSRTISSK